MGGSLRRSGWVLAPLVWAAGLGALRPATGREQGPGQPAVAGDKDKKTDRGPAAAPGARPADWKSELSDFYRKSGEEPPRPALPLRPATVEDRRRLEATRLYTAARGLEDRGLWTDAVALLQDASKLDPDSVAIARRLAKIYIGALGRPDLAIQYARRVLTIDPGDTETLSRLVDFHAKRGDPEEAEALLKEVLANPKLPAHAPGRLVADFELGRLYSARLKQVDKAAEAFARVIDELDDKSANRLSPAELQRILGNEPAAAYLNFAMIFLAAKRDDLVVKALERGLVYDEDNPQIALLLADALLRLKKTDRALDLVDRTIRRQPQGVEAYDLLARVLKAMGREREITPRLEEAARRDSKNVPLQYVLADRYRETGQVDKAEAIYKTLLDSQPTPQTFRALAGSLLKRKKYGDLLRVFCEAVIRPNTQEAVRPQLQAVAQDDEMAEGMLDAGLAQLSAKPPALPPIAFKVLAAISGVDRGVKPARLEKLLKLHRLELAQAPSSLVYREIADTQRRLGRYAEAASTVEEMFTKYPAEKSVSTLVFLAEFRRRAGQLDAARASLAEARKLDPRDSETRARLAQGFRDVGQADEAIAILREIARQEPANPLYALTLGEVLARFGRNDEAIKVYEDVLRRHGDNDEVVKFARSGLSVTYVNMGNYPKGEAELELLLQRNPDEPGPNNDLGYLFAEQGKNLERAEAMIQKALQEEPENSSYLDSMGWVLFKRGKVKEALETMKKAAERMTVERSEPDSTILEHLGDVYFRLQDLRGAEDSWSQALKAAEAAIPPEKRAGEIRKKLESLRALGPKARATSRPSP